MTCDPNCGFSPCTSIAETAIHISNIVVSPPNPQPGTTFTISVDVNWGGLLSNAFIDVCIFDTDTKRCITDSGFNWFSPITTSTIGPITMPAMPNHNLNLQIATRKQELFQVWYSCGDYQNITITPYVPPGTTFGCNPSTGFCEPGYGTFPDSTCAGTCGSGGGGFGTCSPACLSSDMCVMGMCLPKPLVFIGVATLLYSFLKK